MISAPQAYRESAVLTAPPERLVLMLYDGTRRFLYQAAAAMREGNISYCNERLQRAEAILDELSVTLDHEAGGEIAGQLASIYAFCRRHLGEARVSRDADKIEEVSGLIAELRGAWAQICQS